VVHQPRLDNTRYHQTKNARGYMHPISLMGEKFIQFSKTVSPVLDMGCAYGSVILKALDEGAKKIIACDMEQKHLDILRAQLSETESQRVEILKGLLPNGFSINPDSVAGIYISHVLEYLNGREVGESLENFYQWLKPGGKLFIKCYTIKISDTLIYARYDLTGLPDLTVSWK
jgi:SAM-dependent methyltransferase